MTFYELDSDFDYIVLPRDLFKNLLYETRDDTRNDWTMWQTEDGYFSIGSYDDDPINLITELTERGFIHTNAALKIQRWWRNTMNNSDTSSIDSGYIADKHEMERETEMEREMEREMEGEMKNKYGMRHCNDLDSKVVISFNSVINDIKMDLLIIFELASEFFNIFKFLIGL